MSDIKPKKYKKQGKNQDAGISKLASDILSDNGGTEEVSPAVVEDAPEVPSVYEETKDNGKIPGKTERESEIAKPIIFDRGTSRATAFVLNKRKEEMHTILGKLFGYNNGDYFISNENTSTTFKDGIRRRHQFVWIEDKNGFKYGLWFDMTNLGAVY